jgi:hypothetical protein
MLNSNKIFKCGGLDAMPLFLLDNLLKVRRIGIGKTDINIFVSCELSTFLLWCKKKRNTNQGYLLLFYFFCSVFEIRSCYTQLILTENAEI